MDLTTVKLVYFSPTRTTMHILEKIADGLGAETIQHIDLTLPDAGTTHFDEIDDGFVILGAPVYEGRVSKTAISRLQRLRGNKIPAAVVVVYGNRAYEDALLELGDIAENMGLFPIAGAAFIGEHSFATKSRPIANGRPDNNDIARARDFGYEIRSKMEALGSTDDLSLIALPGNDPYIDRDRSALADKAAKTLEEKCTLCGECELLCPVGAITVRDAVTTDNLACILCNACVKNCPEGARVVDDPMINKIVSWVSKNCQVRQEPEIFI
ncbi:MAG: 4Fe-4S dicluster domain-containing protein [Xanthomonadaceae bacterium]|nr:4Fe-4S dicluster domain-containing protein [Xanthomonadaceae bacterium]